jgi:hypothetical protein
LAQDNPHGRAWSGHPARLAPARQNSLPLRRAASVQNFCRKVSQSSPLRHSNKPSFRCTTRFNTVVTEEGTVNTESNEIGTKIVAASMAVHSRLGPGLLESAYRACLAYELKKADLTVRHEVGIPIRYDDVALDVGYRADLLVANSVP